MYNSFEATSYIAMQKNIVEPPSSLQKRDKTANEIFSLWFKSFFILFLYMFKIDINMI